MISPLTIKTQSRNLCDSQLTAALNVVPNYVGRPFIHGN